MKGLNYSSITTAIRRIHQAKKKSDANGVPIKELLDQDQELRQKLFREREEKKQRRDFLKAAGGLGLGAGLMSASPLAFAGHSHWPWLIQPKIAIIGAGAGGHAHRAPADAVRYRLDHLRSQRPYRRAHVLEQQWRGPFLAIPVDGNFPR